ncbi:MAG: glutathione-disulfide reductase [Kiloniellales bacterium]
MPDYDFDLFTIGGGSGGVRASRLAGALGRRAAVCEVDRLGGTCVNRGCIPKKFYVYAAHFREDFEDARAFGWSPGEVAFDWPTLVAAKEKELVRLNGVYESALADNTVTILRGRSRVIDPHTVRVGDVSYGAAAILVATGSRPTVPEVPGREHAITSDEAFDLERLPERLVIVGGGYIAVEFAGIFNGLGSRVTQLYRGEAILRGFDDDVRLTLADEMRKKGVDLRLNTNLTGIQRRGETLLATTTTGEVLETDQVMFATGRQPNTDGLGLAEAGVELADNGAVRVDAYSKSTVGSIHAIGDVTDRLKLTPVALYEAACLIETLYKDNPTAPDHRDVPSAVFSQPPVGTVGLPEAEARKAHGAIDVYRASFPPLKHTITGRDERTMMKLVVERAGGRVVGAHMVGADAPEIIQGVAIAVKGGAAKAQFDATIGIHPTAAEEFVTLREPLPEPPRAEAAD